MSQDLAEIKASNRLPPDEGSADALHVTSFFGGPRGRCIQLTPSYSAQFVQLDRAGVEALIKTLQGWLDQ